MNIEVDACSNMGCVRDTNEDMILLMDQFIRDNAISFSMSLNTEDRFIAAVADGMGGHNGGEVASEDSVRDLDSFFYGLPDKLSSELFMESFKQWIQQVHRLIMLKGNSHPDLSGMGTTLVGLLVYENKIFWINCGDSRLYRLRGEILCQISTDHSLREMTGNAQAPSNIIMNSIGAGETVFLDITEISGSVFDGDAFLLCSDGLNDMLDDEQIESALIKGNASSLVEEALKAGGKDNVSVCLIRFSKMKDDKPDDIQESIGNNPKQPEDISVESSEIDTETEDEDAGNNKTEAIHGVMSKEAKRGFLDKFLSRKDKK